MLKSVGKGFTHNIMQEILEFKFEMNIQLFLLGVISEKIMRYMFMARE